MPRRRRDQSGPCRSTGRRLDHRDKVAEILTKAGYGPIISMEADDGHWEGKTTKGGQKIEFHVDPHSGVITKAEPDD